MLEKKFMRQKYMRLQVFFQSAYSGFANCQFICHKAFSQIPKVFVSLKSLDDCKYISSSSHHQNCNVWRCRQSDDILFLCHKNSQNLKGEVKHYQFVNLMYEYPSALRVCTSLSHHLHERDVATAAYVVCSIARHLDSCYLWLV